MNTALTIIGLSMLIFSVVFYLKRTKEKRKAQLEEREKIKAYGEEINEKTGKYIVLTVGVFASIVLILRILN